MSLSSVSADVRNEQQAKSMNENEFNNEKLNQDDEFRFNSSNANNFKSTSVETNRSDSVIDSSKNVDSLLDNNSEKAAFSLNRLNEQMVHSIVDQNNNEFFSTGIFNFFFFC